MSERGSLPGDVGGGVDLLRARTFRLRTESPSGTIELSDVVSVRFTTNDGQRGVLWGHEPSCAVLRRGVVRVLARADHMVEESFLATEGGLAWIEREEVRLLSRWATGPASLDELIRRLGRRASAMARAEADARAEVARHEVATQRALARLRREVER